MTLKRYKKILPKTKTGEIIESMGGGGPRGFSRSKKIEEVQTKPKKSLLKQKPAPKTKATSKGGTYKGKSKHAIARGRVLQAENEEGLRRMKAYKGKHKNPHTT